MKRRRILNDAVSACQAESCPTPTSSDAASPLNVQSYSCFEWGKFSRSRLAEFNPSTSNHPDFYKDSRNVGLWAKKRAQDMGVDLGPSFDETVEKARTGKILDEV